METKDAWRLLTFRLITQDTFSNSDVEVIEMYQFLDTHLMHVLHQTPVIDRAIYVLYLYPNNEHVNLLHLEALAGYVGQSESCNFTTRFSLFI